VQSAHGRADIVSFLRQSGAKDDIPNTRGETERALAERLGESVFTAN
jgi:hypothetical protein